MRTRNEPDRQRQLDLHPQAAVLRAQLTALNLTFIRDNHQALAQTAADKHWSHLDYLTELASSEAAARDDRRVQRRIRDARFPVIKTLDQFDWNWPTKINRMHIQNLFHLDFVTQHANVVFIAGTGLKQKPPDDRARPRCVPAWTLGAVHRRHRHRQHADLRASCGQSQARHGPLRQTATAVH